MHTTCPPPRPFVASDALRVGQVCAEAFLAEIPIRQKLVSLKLMEASKKSRKRGLRLLRRLEILLPTLRGWFILLLMGGGLAYVTVQEIHPFLATTHPVSGGALIVEGWIPDHAYENVIAEFNQNRYNKLYVTGGPIEQDWCKLGEMTYAEAGAAIARRKGIPSK
jgi:hypothetical protein